MAAEMEPAPLFRSPRRRVAYYYDSQSAHPVAFSPCSPSTHALAFLLSLSLSLSQMTLETLAMVSDIP